MTAPQWADRKVLVLGAEGMLGRALMAALGDRFAKTGHRQVVGWDLAELDICDADAVAGSVKELSPSLVVNAAAYTDVDGCERHVKEAMAANMRGPSYLAKACTELDALLVHFGTDFNFDGKSDRPYQPDDPANPLSVYGRSKAEGERAVREAGCRHLIVRTSWLFGVHGRHFVGAILAQARKGQPLRVVDDQVGRPTLAEDLADAVVLLLDAGATGTVHFANSGAVSWFGFAQEIVRQVGLDVVVEPIQSAQLERPARRPCFSVLDTAGYTKITGQEPDRWQDALARYLNILASQESADTGAGG